MTPWTSGASSVGESRRIEFSRPVVHGRRLIMCKIVSWSGFSRWGGLVGADEGAPLPTAFSTVAWTAGGGASWMASADFSAVAASYPSLLNVTIQNLRVHSSR
jgi:hypothetical protein